MTGTQLDQIRLEAVRLAVSSLIGISGPKVIEFAAEIEKFLREGGQKNIGMGDVDRSRR